jgi:hypothetical protein
MNGMHHKPFGDFSRFSASILCAKRRGCSSHSYQVVCDTSPPYFRLAARDVADATASEFNQEIEDEVNRTVLG